MIGCAFHIVRHGDSANVGTLVPLPAGLFELIELDRLRADGLTDGNVVAGSAGSQRNGGGPFRDGSPGAAP